MAGEPRRSRRASAPEAGRRIAASEATWHALDQLCDDLGVDLHELAGEAFEDLLRKHGRPTSLREALRESARQFPANDCDPLGVTRRS